MCAVRFSITVLILLYGVVSAIGQHQSLAGKITVKGDADVLQAFVIVKSEDMLETLAYTSPDVDGKYFLMFSTDEEYVCVTVRGMGIKMVTERVSSAIGRLDFTVETEAYSIREVIIKSSKIEQREDTIKYNVSAFKAPEDRVIEDVIKKLPGISVQDGGGIFYKGKPVSLTIDGQDMLKGKYSIATRNISPDHISTVEILENHQVVKALQGLVPGNVTTLNLRLKASSRGILLCSVGVGGGYGDDWLRDLESAGMWFGHRNQHIVTAKHNNVGTDLSYELSDHERRMEHRPTYSQALLASPPNLGKTRYYFNNSFAATANNLLKTSGGDRLVANVGYLKSDDVRDGLSESAFLMPDSTRNEIHEKISNTIGLGRLYTDLSYTRNKEKNYIRANVIVKGDGINVGSVVNSLFQNSSDKDISVDADMTLIHRTAERTGYELTMSVHGRHDSQNLDVRFSESPAVQNVSQGNIAVSGTLKGFQKLNIKGMMISPKLFYDLRSDRLKSDLVGRIEASKPFFNDLTFSDYRFVPSVDASYLTTRFSLEMSLPLSMSYLHLSGSTLLESYRLDFVPSVDLKYRFSALWDAGMRYSMNRNDRTVETLFNGIIMRNYRTFLSYNPALTRSRSHNFNAGLNYKDIFKMLFAGVSASCTIERPDVLFGNNYDGIYSETISVKTNALAKSYRCGFDLGKGFYWKNTNLKSRMDYLFSDVPYLAQDKESRIKSNTLRLVTSLSLEPFNFINVSYSLNMLHTCSRQAMGDSFDPLFTASNILSVTFRIPRGITLALLGDNYINNQASENRSFTLMDATLGFTFRKMSCTVLCRNLLDVKKYVYSNIRVASSFSSTYLIRPRDFLFKIVFAL